MRKLHESEIFRDAETFIFHYRKRERHKGDNQQGAVTIAVIVDQKGAYSVATALCKEGDNFARAIGRNLATLRANIVMAINRGIIPESRQPAFLSHERLTKRYGEPGNAGVIHTLLRELTFHSDGKRAKSFIDRVCETVTNRS